MRIFIKLLGILLITFISFNTVADDLRPVSLNIKQISKNNFKAIWKIPSKNSKRMRLDLAFDKSTIIDGPIKKYSYGNAFIEEIHLKRDLGLTGLVVKVNGLERYSIDVLLRITDLEENTLTSIINNDKKFYEVKGEISKNYNTLAYIKIGVEHILIGLDHLLFIACLIFVCSTKKKLFLTITGFTLSHSITLILSSMGILNIALPPVEAVIALSILFLALEIVKNNKQSLTFKYPVLVSSVFGLLHGFGFASVLSDIGLPSKQKVLALLYFNIGVEIGQILFVAFLFLIFLMASKLFKNLERDNYSKLIGYFSGTTSIIWLITRLQSF
jgi:hydrogenase/urease accessory protein HupE